MTLLLVTDIPKLYTAIAEWLACALFIFLCGRKIKGFRLFFVMTAGLFVQCIVNYLAGLVHPHFWIGWMIINFVLMAVFLRICTGLSVRDALFYAVRAFIYAEFAAALEWQLFYYFREKGMQYGKGAVLMLLVVYGAVFMGIYFAEKRHIPADGRLNIGYKEVFSSLLIAVVIFFMSNISFVFQNTPFSSTLTREIFYIRTLVDLVGAIVLYLLLEQRFETDLLHELGALDNILQKQYDRYRISKENDELISHKYHDLKHQIAIIRAENNPEKKEAYLKEMNQIIKNHEAENRTGNDVLDTILFGKSLYCTQHDINFTCMADGNIIGFMEIMDICTIFGNALDNAIESVEQTKDIQKRLITMNLSGLNDFVIIVFENYFEGSLKMESGMPVSTKKEAGYHGFGLKSIQMTVEKYEGTVTTGVKENWFSLRILIPMKKQ